VLLERVAEPAGGLDQRVLERLVGERLDLAAVVTNEVMVVMRVRMCRLEPCDAVADVDALHEPELDERLERPVHACDTGRPASGVDPVVDLLRRAAAVLDGEKLDDRAPGAAAPEPRCAKALECMFRPGHRVNDSDSHCLLACGVMVSRIVLLYVGIALAAAGCGGGGSSGGADTVAAFYPLAYAAEQVGVEDVVNLTPPGAEPHDLELTARDVERIRDAALVVYLGHGFQPALDDALDGRDGPTLDVLESVDVLRGGEGGVDPHVWLDPVRYAAIVRAIAEATGDASAADGFVRRLDALTAEFRRGLAHCSRREIVTSHAAFAYLAERFDLRQVPLVGVTPEAEPTPKEVERLVREVRTSGATTVFFETLVSPELAETVAREAGAGTAVLDPLEGLTPAEIEAGADYVSVMRENLAALRTALGCT